MCRKASRGTEREASSTSSAGAVIICPMKSSSWGIFRAMVAAVILCTTLHGQTVPTPAAAGSDWGRVQQVPIGTMIRVSSSHRPTVCSFASADAESLTCTQTRSILFIPITHRIVYRRVEVSLVKMSRQPLSAFVAGAIGAGAGAGIGAAVDNRGSGNYYEGLGPLFFGMLGAGVGASIGRATDFLAGPEIYRAPSQAPATAAAKP